MRHTPRIVVAGRPHHVYLRGNNRRLLFASRTDRVLWIDCVRRALDATRCRLHQMALLNNRVHAIITPPDEAALSDAVKRACERFAQLRNKERGGSGRLFAVGFRSTPLLDDDELRRATLYADAAALRAGKVTDPFVHAWSTSPLHAGLPGTHALRSVWTPSAWYARLGRTPLARAVAYRRAMVELLMNEHTPAIDLEVEAEDAAPYGRRVARPNGTWAREGQLQYGRKDVERRRVGD